MADIGGTRLEGQRDEKGLSIHRPSTWPLLAQVAAVLALVVLAISIFTGLTVRHLETRWLQERFRDLAKDTIGMVSGTVLNAAIVQDRPVLQNIVEELVLAQPNIEIAQVVNNEGFVLAMARSQLDENIMPQYETLDVVQQLSLMGEVFGTLDIRWNIDSEMERINQHAVRFAILVSSSVFVAGLVLMLVIHRMAIRPVDLINRRIRMLQPGEALEPMQLRAAPELSRLNQAIDELADGYQSQQKLEGRLQQAQKMEAVGRLAGGVAHNFNNALMVVLGYTELLWARMRKWDGPDISKELEAIQQAGEQSASLTKQLLAFGRQQPQQTELVDPSNLIASMKKLLRPLTEADVDLVVKPSNERSMIRVDVGLFESILMNLIGNAQDAMPDGGRITISSNRVQRVVDAQGVEVQRQFSRINVSDTGEGMDEKTRSQIFEPFFTTKVPGKGTGLGLSTVYGIMQDSGGWVEVSSELGVGTTFSLFFPEATDIEDLIGDQQTAIEELQGSETILIVEDEPGVLELTETILKEHGYEVLTAANGLEGERISKNLGISIDLLLTDAVMPGMNGVHLGESVRKLRPRIPIIYMSGYVGKDLENKFGAVEEDRYLRKPFSPYELLKIIREQFESANQLQ
ncbi:MAG: hypothetical protein CMJ32_01105 [Phycisphaerae bacterium]|nr:hypothetical protein [Phycisphaerae bacterium]